MSRLHPQQFQVNEAWVAFTLNETPIETEQDGSFNCICLMDAASCYILATGMVPLHQGEPSRFEARRLFAAALKQGTKPSKLFVPTTEFKTHLRQEAKRQGIEVIPVAEQQLQAFTGEARESYREHVQGGRRKL